MSWISTSGSCATRGFARTVALAFVVCGVALSSVACSTETNEPPSGGVAGGTESFSQLFQGYAANYVPAESPSELAEMSSAVVTGHISRVVQGQSTKPVDEESTPAETVLMVVKVEKIHAGALPTDTEEVFVELPAPGGVDASAFDQAAPKEDLVLLFLGPSPGLERGYEVVEQGKEWPGAALVMEPTNPQGFLIAENEEQVLYPLDHELTEGVSLSQFLPNNNEFPVESQKGS